MDVRSQINNLELQFYGSNLFSKQSEKTYLNNPEMPLLS